MTESDLKVRVIRLITGEDIVGICLNDDKNEFVDIENPMRVVLNRLSKTEQMTLLLMPWLPIEILEDNVARINYSDIITVMEPRLSFIEYYLNLLDKYEKQMNEHEDDASLFSDSEESLFDEYVDELLENKEEIEKKQTYH